MLSFLAFVSSISTETKGIAYIVYHGVVEPKFRFGVNQEEFSLQKDCLTRGIRVYVPPPLRAKVLAELHSTHFGVLRIKFLARSYGWWEGIYKDIERIVSDCTACQVTRSNPPKVSFHCWETPSEPFQRIPTCGLCGSVSGVLLSDSLRRIFRVA